MPEARTVYDVQKKGNHWQVMREGGKRASFTTTTQADAIQRARAIAQHKRRSQVRVKGEDGAVRTEWTYGDDPRSIPG